VPNAAFDERARNRCPLDAGLRQCRQMSEALSAIPQCRGRSWPHATTASIRRGGPERPHLQMRTNCCEPVCSRRRASCSRGPALVAPQGVGGSVGATQRDRQGPCGLGLPDRRDRACDLADQRAIPPNQNGGLLKDGMRLPQHSPRDECCVACLFLGTRICVIPQVGACDGWTNWLIPMDAHTADLTKVA
jgi:hypothetical protein